MGEVERDRSVEAAVREATASDDETAEGPQASLGDFE
jgi:hypothetical protein